MTAVAPPAPTHERVTAYSWYVLVLLTLAYVSNHIDRQILSILLEAIKLDLGLSDQALGFLAGFAFAAFYAVLGIPITLFMASLYDMLGIAVSVFFLRSVTDMAISHLALRALGQGPPATTRKDLRNRSRARCRACFAAA